VLVEWGGSHNRSAGRAKASVRGGDKEKRLALRRSRGHASSHQKGERNKGGFEKRRTVTRIGCVVFEGKEKT